MFKDEMRTYIDLLHKWDDAYNKGTPLVSDKKYDDTYFELMKLEKTGGFAFKDSPTQNIRYKVVNELTKVKHNHPLLSLAKTKSIEDLNEFIGDKHYTVMAKMDGLTISVRYIDGVLVSAETRGNGEIGEDILHNARTIKNLPQVINYEDELIIDGEAIITYEDFEEFKDRYANPRNLVSGSVRLLNANEAAARNISFVAWKVYKGFSEEVWYSKKLDKLDDLGFTTVPRINDDDYNQIIEPHDLESLIEEIKIDCDAIYSYPIDGCVIGIDNIKEAAAMGEATNHHEKYQMAYKFYDEEYDSRLKYIEYTMSRNGTLTPVAVFDPVDTGESTVERASLHNLSIMEEIMGDCCYAGQPIKIIKANQIIPQIIWAKKLDYGTVISLGGVTVDGFSGDLRCPICGSTTSIIKSESGTKTLICDNSQCEGKLTQRIEFFGSKKALDIKGLSLKTIEKLNDWGWLNSIIELFSLSNFKNEWINKPGFGIASVDKILSAIEESKNSPLDKFICACGIKEIGAKASKDLAKKFKTWNGFREATYNELVSIDGIGDIMAENILNFDYSEFDDIAENIMTNLSAEVQVKESLAESLEGKTFVITGKLSQPRSSIEAMISAAGGKVTGSVSSKTSYLVIDNVNSTTGKAKTAREKKIPMISEEELYKMMHLGKNV